MRDVRPVPKTPIALARVTWEDGSHDLMGRGSGRKETFEELLQRARSGDHSALEEIFRRARPRLQREASKRVTKRQPGGESRSDIEQESAQRALAKLDTFQGSTEAEFFQWLDRILYSRVMQSARDAQRAKRKIPGGLPLDTPEAAAAPSPRTSPSLYDGPAASPPGEYLDPQLIDKSPLYTRVYRRDGVTIWRVR